MKQYRIKKSKRDVIDLIDKNTMLELIKKGEFRLFVNIFDTLQYVIFKVGEMPNDDQLEVLFLPYELWGKRMGAVLKEMRK